MHTRTAHTLLHDHGHLHLSAHNISAASDFHTLVQSWPYQCMCMHACVKDNTTGHQMKMSSLRSFRKGSCESQHLLLAGPISACACVPVPAGYTCCLQAIELALEQAGGAKAESSLFLDDSTRNIAAGHQKGLATVLVRKCMSAAKAQCMPEDSTCAGAP